MPAGVYVPAQQNDLALDTDVGPSPGQGSLFYKGVSKWNALPPAPAGSVLVSGGAGADPVWTPASGTLTGAVILAPASATRNIIQPTGNFRGLAVKAGSTAFSELFTIFDGNDVPVGRFWSDGTMTFSTIIDYSGGIGLDLTLESSSQFGATGTSSIIQAYPNAAGADVYYGGYYEVKSGNSFNFNQPVVGGLFQATHLGLGTVSSSFGGWFVAAKSGQGAITAAYGGNFQVQNNNPIGTIADGAGCRIQSPSLVGAITTSRGIYIQNQGGAGVTNAYGIYLDPISGASGMNFALLTQGGLHQFGDQVAVLGSADRVQSIVRANPTQTANLAEWQNSGGTALASFGPTGLFNHAITATNTSGTFNMEGATYTLAPAADSSVTFSAQNIATNATTAFNFTSGTGIFGEQVAVNHNGTGTVTQGVGVNAEVVKGSTGVITTAIAGQFRVRNNNATNAITSAIGVHVVAPVLTGGITTCRGVRIQNQGGAGVTTAQGLVIENQTGAATNNVAILTNQGLVQFGDVTTILPPAFSAGTGTQDALAITSTYNLPAAGSATIDGIKVVTLLNSTGASGGNSFINGVYSTMQVNTVTAGNTIANIPSGIRSRAFAAASMAGTVTSLAVFFSDVWGLNGNPAGVITSLMGIYLQAPTTTSSGGGSVANAYGLRIENIAGATNANWAIKTGTGLVEFGDRVQITGSSDQNQLLIRGFSTQTNNLLLLQNSSLQAMLSILGNGQFISTYRDAATNSPSTLGPVFGHNSSATPANGFGQTALFRLQSSTTADQTAAHIQWSWVDATDATRKCRLALATYDNVGSAREGLRIEADGTMAIVGLVGAATASVAVTVNTGTASYKGLLVKGAASQSANLFECQDSGGQLLTNISSIGALFVRAEDAVTNAPTTVVGVTHGTSGTAANGFGATELWTLEASDGSKANASQKTTTWVDATIGTRKAREVFSVYDSGASREWMRGEASGTAPMIGFLGAGAVVRQTAAAAASDLATVITLANSLRTALINLGLAA